MRSDFCYFGDKRNHLVAQCIPRAICLCPICFTSSHLHSLPLMMKLYHGTSCVSSVLKFDSVFVLPERWAGNGKATDKLCRLVIRTSCNPRRITARKAKLEILRLIHAVVLHSSTFSSDNAQSSSFASCRHLSVSFLLQVTIRIFARATSSAILEIGFSFSNFTLLLFIFHFVSQIICS